MVFYEKLRVLGQGRCLGVGLIGRHLASRIYCSASCRGLSILGVRLPKNLFL